MGSRVLILAPTANDARLTAGFLNKEGIATEICRDITTLCAKLEEGGGALLLAEETLDGGAVPRLLESLSRQSAWSDIPITVITSGGEVSQTRLRRLGVFGPGGNVTLLERPFRPATLVSTIDAALRSRLRQHEVRDLLGKLQAGEERLQGILDSISDAFVSIDRDWRIAYMNPSYLRLVAPLHQCAEELIRQNLWEKFPDIVDTEVGRFYRRMMEERTAGTLEVFYPPLEAWLEIRAFPSPNGLSLYVQDISERKAAELERTRLYDQIRKNADRLDLAMGAASLGDWSWDVASDLMMLSARAAEIFGVPADARLTRAELRELLHEDDREKARDATARAVEEGVSYENEYRVHHPDGTQRWVAARGVALRDAAGRTTGLLGVVQDITRRKEREQEVAELTCRIRDQARVFDTALSNISDFTYTFDRDGRFIYANKPLLDFWGITLEEVIGKNFHDLNYPEELASRLHGQIRQVFETGPSVRDEMTFPGVDGEVGYYEYILSPVFDPDGRVGIVAGSTRDITERKKTEQALSEAKEAAEAANRAKDHFLAVLSHELRTPLTPVLMTASALAADATIPAALRTDMAMICRNVELETKLIDDLLDLSRITTGKLALHMRVVEMNDAVRQVCAICEPEIFDKGVRLDLDLDERAGHVRADPARLQQVLWNLLKNSAKFTPKGGCIRVVTHAEAGGRVRLAVEDSGIGIDPSVLSKIFDAFEQGAPGITRQFGGLGLGLAITKALVELHEGRIEAASEGVGRGSTFTIELPASVTAPAVEGSANVEARGDGSLRILIVEDHQDTARMLARLLGSTGYEVAVANTATDGLALAEGRVFDLVVSDIGLPDLTGYEFMQRLMARQKVQGIAMSGYGMEEDVRRSLEAGFSEHLVKPVSLASIEQAIRRLARKVRSAGPS